MVLAGGICLLVVLFVYFDICIYVPVLRIILLSLPVFRVLIHSARCVLLFTPIFIQISSLFRTP